MKIIRVLFVFVFLLGSIQQPVQANKITMLDQEAGIAAFFQFPGPTNLKSNLLRNQFRTISMEGLNYLLGFVPVAGLESFPQFDVKVLVHNAGWVVAYYPKEKPTAIILRDFNKPTRLDDTLAKIAFGLDLTSYEVSYTDYHFPLAQKMLLIQMDHKTGTRTFDFHLPITSTYFDRSYMDNAYGWAMGLRFKLDSKIIANPFSSLVTDTIRAEDMVTGAKHIVELYDCCYPGYFGMIILYTGDAAPIVNYAESLSTIDLVTPPDGLMLAVQDIPVWFSLYLPRTAR